MAVWQGESPDWPGDASYGRPHHSDQSAWSETDTCTETGNWTENRPRCKTYQQVVVIVEVVVVVAVVVVVLIVVVEVVVAVVVV